MLLLRQRIFPFTIEMETWTEMQFQQKGWSGKKYHRELAQRKRTAHERQTGKDGGDHPSTETTSKRQSSQRQDFQGGQQDFDWTQFPQFPDKQ